MSYSVSGRVYRALSGEDAYEYEVTLFKDGEMVDRWDSLFECYSIHTGHLTHERAVSAVQEITADVHAGRVGLWFDL